MFKQFFLSVWAVLVLASCGGGVDVAQPPEIAYGQDVCDRCNMIISEEKFAAAYWTEAGEARRFDDIGGMLAYVQDTGEEVATYWVHDVVTGEWLRADEATFVVDSGLATPMGFGVAACADPAQAEALAYGQERATVLDFAELLAALAAGTLDLDPMHGHDMAPPMP